MLPKLQIVNINRRTYATTYVQGSDEPSLTIPGQSIDLRTVMRKLANGESVPTVAMMYDKDPSFDDPDLSDIDPRFVTPNLLRVDFGVGKTDTPLAPSQTE